VPILAAVLGLVGGMAGAYVGGSVANAGQQQRFDNERQTRIENLRIATYTSYLRELASWNDVGGVPSKVSAAQAQVLLVSSSPAVRTAAIELFVAAERNSESAAFRSARGRFIVLAQREVNVG
jgi:hypothetical protein